MTKILVILISVIMLVFLFVVNFPVWLPCETLALVVHMLLQKLLYVVIFVIYVHTKCTYKLV